MAAWVAVPGLIQGVASLTPYALRREASAALLIVSLAGAALTASLYFRAEPWFARALWHAWLGSCLGFLVTILPPLVMFASGRWQPVSPAPSLLAIPVGLFLAAAIFVGGFGFVARPLTTWRGERSVGG